MIAVDRGIADVIIELFMRHTLRTEDQSVQDATTRYAPLRLG